MRLMGAIVVLATIAAATAGEVPKGKNSRPQCRDLDNYGAHSLPRNWIRMGHPPRICVGEGRVLVLLEKDVPGLSIRADPASGWLRAVLISLDPTTLDVTGSSEVRATLYHSTNLVCPANGDQYLLAGDKLMPIGPGLILGKPIDGVPPGNYGFTAAIQGDVLASVSYYAAGDGAQIRDLASNRILWQQFYPSGKPYLDAGIGGFDRLQAPLISPDSRQVVFVDSQGANTIVALPHASARDTVGAWWPMAACGNRIYSNWGHIPFNMREVDPRTGDAKAIALQGHPKLDIKAITCDSAGDPMLYAGVRKYHFFGFGAAYFSDENVYRYIPGEVATNGELQAAPIAPPPPPPGFNTWVDQVRNVFGLAYDNASGDSYTLNRYRVCRVPPF